MKTLEDVVAVIQQKEHDYSELMIEAEDELGEDATTTALYKAKWAALYNLCLELNIGTI